MINLYNNDCLKILSDSNLITDKSIDCLITDPPYNISRETNLNTVYGYENYTMDYGKWDSEFDLTSYIDLLPRVLKENANIVIFNDWKNLGKITEACKKNHIIVKRCLVLNKVNPTPLNRDRMFVNDVEFAIWGVYNSKDKPTGWTFNRMNIFEKCCIDTSTQHCDFHPTVKDLKVISYLVELLSKPGDTVLDCFMGSGTTGVACKGLNRNFVGIELDENYFNGAKERIANTGMVLDTQIADREYIKGKIVLDNSQSEEALW